MTLRYRTTGAWGAGTGYDLPADEVDENFYTLKQLIDAIPAGDAGVGVSNITSVGTQITFHLTDLTTLGPFNIPTPRVPEPIAVSGSTYTLLVADVNKYLRCSNAAGCTVTVPISDELDVPVGSEYHFRQAPGCTAITFIEGETGVTINGVSGFSLGTDAEGAVATLKKVGTDEWDLFGHLAIGTF